MINFISIENYSKDNDNFYKGLLFEEFIIKVLKNLGYREINGRVKKNSLEYDFEAKHAVEGNILVGEAKAYDKKIDATIITSFIGKMQPYWLNEDTKATGLIITTSELTPDAEDYLRTIKDKINFKLIDKKNIFNYIEDSLNVPKIEYVKNQVKNRINLKISKVEFIISDKGEFYLVFLSENDKLLATHYCIVDEKLCFIKDSKLNTVLKSKWSELNDLNFLSEGKNIEIKNIPGKDTYKIKKSNILYTDHCFDYKLPVSPKYFIGREYLITEFLNFIKERIKGSKNKLIFQIISRSGVGKSSAILKIADTFKDGNILITKDTREIKSRLDYELLQKEILMTTSENLKIELSDNLDREFLERVDVFLEKENKNLIIFLDQFESLFNSEEIFDSLLDLFKDCFQLTKRIVFVIARKNDQPTTFDDKSNIDLKALSDISKIYLLNDFIKTEAMLIFRYLEIELGKRINKNLINLILEFSQGFPWLLKRLCSHLIQQIKEGTALESIVSSSLNLKDLFDEELNELNEDEKDYFIRIVRNLPATINGLSILFEEREILFTMLKRFQDKRLLRVSGNTYDTYNDVLKEYLIYGTIADFNISFLFRSAFVPSIIILKELIEKKAVGVENFKREKKFSDGTFFNKTKEIRNLKLINYNTKTGILEINKEVMNAYENKNLASYIRMSTRKNGTVTGLLSLLNKMNSIDYYGIKKFIKENFPLINANDKTWDLYARNLIDWLLNIAILEERDKRFFINQKASQEISLSLGNFEHIHSKGRKNKLFPYTPRERVNRIIQILKMNKNDIIDESNLTRSDKNVLSDAIILKLVEKNVGRNVITKEGKLFFEDKNYRIQFIRELLLSIRELREFLNYLLKQDDRVLVKQAFEEYAKNVGWTKTTLDWIAKLMVNWFEEGELAIRQSRRKLFPNKENIKKLLENVAF